MNPPLPADAPRVSDGRYALVTRLGEGGMAVVYGAWDEHLRIWRAVKVLLPKYARRRSVRRRFEREARTLMTLRHPNLVRVLEVNADRALPYLVMDLVPGGSLEDWIVRHGPMPPRLALDAAVQVVRGLSAVHAAGIVHRDVKPQNVLVDADGTCKLTDFGVAHVSGGDTRTGVAMGTMGYMAPEQLADSKSVDARSDVYSVGAMLYVLVTGGPVRDLFRVADDLSRLDAVPEALRTLLATCLAYEREDRYPDAKALLAALDAVRDRFPPVGPEVPPLPRRRTSAAGAPGGSPGEFTELSGLLEQSVPPEDRRPRKAPVSAVASAEPTAIRDDDTDDEAADHLAETRSGTRSGGTPTGPPARAEARGLAPIPTRTGFAAPAGVASAAVGTLATVIGLGAVAAVILAVVVPLLAAAGSADVRTAGDAASAAARVVEERVRDHDRLLLDVARLGIDDTGLATAAAAAPATFARALAAACRTEILERRDDSDAELSRQRLERVVWAVDHLDQAEAEWLEVAHRPLGRLAVAVGLATAPGAGPAHLGAEVAQPARTSTPETVTREQAAHADR